MNTPNEGARLIANNVLQATQTQGLVAVVRHQIETTLSDLVGVLLSKAACDFRRVLRPVGEQTHSINIEPYHGHQTWARFRTEIAGCESLVALDKIIQENQPVLFGHVSHSGGSQQIGDVVALVLPLCAAVLRYERSKLSIDESIAKVISELDQILTTGVAIQEHLTVLSGLKFPSEIECVALSSDTVIRRLTESEISEFGSSDITSDGRHTFTLLSASTALVVRRKTSTSFH